MSKEEKVPQYKTIKRLQKNYLIRCNDSLKNIIPGSGIKSASQIKRTEAKHKSLIADLQALNAEDMLNQDKKMRRAFRSSMLNAPSSRRRSKN